MFTTFKADLEPMHESSKLFVLWDYTSMVILETDLIFYLCNESHVHFKTHKHAHDLSLSKKAVGIALFPYNCSLLLWAENLLSG
jgi:hypothetical protein